MKISLLEPIGISEEKINELSRDMVLSGHEFTYYDTKAGSVEEQIKRSAGQDIIMIANSPYPDEVIRSNEDLKLLAVAFTGIDHVGLSACKEQGVTVCNCAGYSDQAVAELVIGMTLAVYRKILQGDQAVQGGLTSAGLMGIEIAGKTVGVIGCGKIGTKTARLFKAFDARVLAYDVNVQAGNQQDGIEYVELTDLLQESDIVSLHMPQNESTRGFISRERIGMMKPDSIFINCARGPIVDNQALADALQEGRIAGAAVDVFDMEPPIPADYPLRNAKNLLVTPHVAFFTKEAMLRRADIEFANVYAYLNGKVQNQCKL